MMAGFFAFLYFLWLQCFHLCVILRIFVAEIKKT